jgi:hypothetical protein
MQEFIVAASSLGAATALALAIYFARGPARPAAPPPAAPAPANPGRSAAMQELKERRIRAILAELPPLAGLTAEEKGRAVRFAETAPAVRAVEREIRALRGAERGGQD